MSVGLQLIANMIENKKLTALQNSVYERESMRDEPSRRELAKTLHQVIERAGTNDRDSRKQPESEREINGEADCLVWTYFNLDLNLISRQIPCVINDIIMCWTRSAYKDRYKRWGIDTLRLIRSSPSHCINWACFITIIITWHSHHTTLRWDVVNNLINCPSHKKRKLFNQN